MKRLLKYRHILNRLSTVPAIYQRHSISYTQSGKRLFLSKLVYFILKFQICHISIKNFLMLPFKGDKSFELHYCASTSKRMPRLSIKTACRKSTSDAFKNHQSKKLHTSLKSSSDTMDLAQRSKTTHR